MRKILSVVCMLLGICLFTACSSDDNDSAQSPVSNVSVPASAEIGTSVTIQGTGFTVNARLFLESAEKTRTEVKVETSTVGAVFTVPMTVTAGKYNVILLQNGEWTLGSITLTAPGLPITSLSMPATASPGKQLEISGIGFEEGDALILTAEGASPVSITSTTASASELTSTVPDSTPEGTYTVALVRGANSWDLGTIKIQKAMRIASITAVTPAGDQTLNFSYDSNGRLIKVSDGAGMEYDLTYSSDGNSVSFDSPFTTSMTLKLQNGQVISSPALNSWSESVGNYTWNYTSNYLTGLTGGESDVTFDYDANGNLTAFNGFGELSYEYGSNALNAVPGTLDPAVALNFITLLYANDGILMGCILNKTINVSAKVPTTLSYVVQDETGNDATVSSAVNSTFENNVLTMSIADQQLQNALGSKITITYEEDK